MKMQLSIAMKEDRSFQLSILRSYQPRVFSRKMSAELGCPLKELFLAMIKVSFESSCLRWQLPVSFTDLQKFQEYSWKKNTSALIVSKFDLTFSHFLSSSKKLRLQRGPNFFKYQLALVPLISSSLTVLSTYLSRVWNIAKSQIFTTAFYSSVQSILILERSLSKLESQDYLNQSLLMKLSYLSMPALIENMGEYRVLIFRSILPIFHLKVALSKSGKQVGSSSTNSLLMSFNSVRQSSQQNSKGLFMIPQQFKVAIFRLPFVLSLAPDPKVFEFVLAPLEMHPIYFNNYNVHIFYWVLSYGFKSPLSQDIKNDHQNHQERELPEPEKR